MKYNFGDLISSEKYDIKDGEVIGIEKVAWTPTCDGGEYETEKELDDYLNTYQYSVKFKDEEDGLWKVCTLYEEYFD